MISYQRAAVRTAAPDVAMPLGIATVVLRFNRALDSDFGRLLACLVE